MSANDAGFKAIRDSYRFFLNTNFTHNYDIGAWTTPGLATGPKFPTIDEFIHVLPFEEYDRDFLDAVLPSQPARGFSGVDLYPAFLPGNGFDASSGAWWLTGALDAAPTDLLSLQDPANLRSQEQFNLTRLAVVLEFEKLQAHANRLKAGSSIGPDAHAELLRAGRVMLMRDLSRMAINGDGAVATHNTLPGLHILYNNTFGLSGSANDRQVFSSSVTTFPPDAAAATALLVEVQDLIRLVSPSEGGFGMGPNALLTSWQARDLLIRCERLLGVTPQFLPDVRTGSVRYHFNGVPVYIGPVREDEDEEATTTPVFGGAEGEFTSIYALRVGGESGVRMLHYGGASTDMGVQVETLPEHTANVARGYRLTGYYTLFVPERQAVARMWKVRLKA